LKQVDKSHIFETLFYKRDPLEKSGEEFQSIVFD